MKQVDLEQALLPESARIETGESSTYPAEIIAKLASVPLILVLCCHSLLILGGIRTSSDMLIIAYSTTGLVALLGVSVGFGHQQFRLDSLKQVGNVEWQEHLLDMALLIAFAGVFYCMNVLAQHWLPSSKP